MSVSIPALAPSIAWYEKHLAVAQKVSDPEKTLFMQVTLQELLTLSFGLLWVGRMYGIEAIGPLVSKLEELTEAQGFYRPGGED